MVVRGIHDPSAQFFAFGSEFPEGIHDIHMNQGNPPGEFFGDNGTFQDGGGAAHFPASDRWLAASIPVQSRAGTPMTTEIRIHATSFIATAATRSKEVKFRMRADVTSLAMEFKILRRSTRLGPGCQAKRDQRTQSEPDTADSRRSELNRSSQQGKCIKRRPVYRVLDLERVPASEPGERQVQ